MPRVGLIAGLVVLVSVTVVQATVTMKIHPTIGPSLSGSDNWQGFVDNSLKCLVNGKASISDRKSDPAAFETVSEAHLGQLVVTNFHSWEGFDNPASPFAGERGSRLHFAVRILGNGTKFRLADLSCDIDSDDSGNALDFSASLTNSSYDKHRVGIDYGPDGKRDTDDDIVYDKNEPADKLIDELVYVGVGIAIECTNKSEGASYSDKLDKALAAIGTDDIQIVGSYTLKSPDGADLASASKTVKVESRPSSRPAYLIPPAKTASGGSASSSSSTPAAKSGDSPLPMFIGLGAGLAVVLIYLGAKWAIRRRRYVPLASHRQPPQS